MSLQALRSFITLLSERFVATRCPQVAGSLTFTTLLALVPLVTVSIALFSNFPAFKTLAKALATFLQKEILPELAAQIVTTYALQFSEKAAQLTLIGTALLVVTVLLLLHTIDDVFNDIWGVRKPRPMLTRLAVYWVALTLGPIAVAGSIFATGELVATSMALIGNHTEASAFSALLAPLTLLGTLFSFLYFGTPNHPVKILHALIGGFAAALAFLLMQRLFGLFIARFPTYTLVYGTFAALPIFLVWLYLSWVVVLLGAILAATLPEFVEQRSTMTPFPGSQVLAALNILITLATGQRLGTTAAFELLQTRSRCSRGDTETLLDEMRERGWVTRTEDETWVLTRRAEDLAVSEVVQRFALSTDDWSRAASARPARHYAATLATALRAADATIAELACPEAQSNDHPG
ncbi:MAG: YihY family inner membrane protein [Rhodocyclales bacterium]|nr:YihY family inner membrane protein [Rhodocyclales bacterium]